MLIASKMTVRDRLEQINNRLELLEGMQKKIIDCLPRVLSYRHVMEAVEMSKTAEASATTDIEAARPRGLLANEVHGLQLFG